MSSTSTTSASPQLPLFASGLNSPIKFTLTPKGSLLVSEHDDPPKTGNVSVQTRTLAPQLPPSNTGRITLIDRAGKIRYNLMEGLPVSVATVLPRGKTVYIEIGAWDLVIPGPVPGSEVPNPNPSSPILASILILELPDECDELRSGFSITPEDHPKLLQKLELTLKNADGQKAKLRLLTKFPNFTPHDFPGVPNAVRGSNPFGMVESHGVLYVSDAAQNTVTTADIKTGNPGVLFAFPQMNNPGGMPPTMDAVPDSIRLHDGRLLVPLLSGYPFPAGVAEVRAVSLEGKDAPFLGGLTSVIDILPVRMPNGSEALFVLEFSSNQNANAPGLLLRYNSPKSAPVTVVDNLISPTNLAYDEHTKTLYITEIYAGNIRKLVL